jgi:hypothetical protein
VLTEKALFDVFLDEEEFDRDETEEESDELRSRPLLATALILGFKVLGAVGTGIFFLFGSPAGSVTVLLFGAGSGTSHSLLG